MSLKTLKKAIAPFYFLSKIDKSFTNVSDLDFSRPKEVFFEFTNSENETYEFQYSEDEKTFLGYFLVYSENGYDIELKEKFLIDKIKNFTYLSSSSFDNDESFLYSIVTISEDSVEDETLTSDVLIQKYRGLISAKNLGLL